jgi:hypothetical protein
MGQVTVQGDLVYYHGAVYNPNEPDDMYMLGRNLAWDGKLEVPDMLKGYPEVLMGFEDQRGDDFAAIMYPPKPPLSLAANEKLSDYDYDYDVLTRNWKLPLPRDPGYTRPPKASFIKRKLLGG